MRKTNRINKNIYHGCNSLQKLYVDTEPYLPLKIQLPSRTKFHTCETSGLP